MPDFRDIQISFDEFSTDGFFDIQIGDNDFVIDETLVTADLISEFSDRRVGEDEARDGYRGGWWATEIMGIDPRAWGSRRWTLANKRLDRNTLRLWEQYTEDAYRWQIDEGLLVEVSCVAEIDGLNRMKYTVTKTYPDTSSSKTQSSVLWEGTR
jgi:phage gp46-like protein